jgi:hypothetical protein
MVSKAVVKVVPKAKATAKVKPSVGGTCFLAFGLNGEGALTIPENQLVASPILTDVDDSRRIRAAMMAAAKTQDGFRMTTINGVAYIVVGTERTTPKQHLADCLHRAALLRLGAAYIGPVLKLAAQDPGDGDEAAVAQMKCAVETFVQELESGLQAEKTRLAGLPKWRECTENILERATAWRFSVACEQTQKQIRALEGDFAERLTAARDLLLDALGALSLGPESKKKPEKPDKKRKGGKDEAPKKKKKS